MQVDGADQVGFAGLAGHGDHDGVVPPLAGMLGVQLAGHVGDVPLPRHQPAAANPLGHLGDHRAEARTVRIPERGVGGGQAVGQLDGHRRQSPIDRAVTASITVCSVSKTLPVLAGGFGSISIPSRSCRAS